MYAFLKFGHGNSLTLTGLRLLDFLPVDNLNLCFGLFIFFISLRNSFLKEFRAISLYMFNQIGKLLFLMPVFLTCFFLLWLILLGH